MQALTIAECLDYTDDLTKEQRNLFAECTKDRRPTETFHPNIKSLRELRLWLNDGVQENKAFDEAGTMTPELKQLLADHALWLAGGPGLIRPDQIRANLAGANLAGANLPRHKHNAHERTNAMTPDGFASLQADTKDLTP